jgi:hypothetical protein
LATLHCFTAWILAPRAIRFINWAGHQLACILAMSRSGDTGEGCGGFGILTCEVFTNPSAFEAVRLRGGGSSYPLRPENINEGWQYYEMNGLEVWKQVVQYQPVVIRKAVEKAGYKVEEIEFFIFHQANLRLIKYLMAKNETACLKPIPTLPNRHTADASLPLPCARRFWPVIFTGINWWSFRSGGGVYFWGTDSVLLKMMRKRAKIRWRIRFVSLEVGNAARTGSHHYPPGYETLPR